MRSLQDLLATRQGREFLQERSMFTSLDAFLEALAAPRSNGLQEMTATDGNPIYSLHQVLLDYPASVTSKFAALRRVHGDGRTGIAMFIDTDRSGANPLSATVRWREGVSVRLAPHRTRGLEPRFIPVDRSRLEDLAARLSEWGMESGGDEGAARGSLLGGELLTAPIETLADAAAVLTTALLREHLGLLVPPVRVSELGARGLLTPALEDALADLDAFVTVFNEGIDALLAEDVDPKVHHLDEDYLPLRYSCPDDGARLPLIRERRGREQWAVARCRDGTEHRFKLGTDGALAELTATGRWGVDVTLPIYLNDLVGGGVAGQSTALYGLVLNEVLERVLGRSAVPMLVPLDLGAALEAAAAPPSLLHDYLAAA